MKLSCWLGSHSWCVREAKVSGSKGQAKLLYSIPRLCRHAASGTFLIAVTTCSFVEEGLIQTQSISRAEVYDRAGGWERAWGSCSYCIFREGRQNGARLHNLKIHTPLAHFLVKALPPKGSRTFQNKDWKET